jgi:hypothetical protein
LDRTSPGSDIQIISAIFQGEVITARFGKLTTISLPQSETKKGRAMADPALGSILYILFWALSGAILPNLCQTGKTIWESEQRFAPH